MPSTAMVITEGYLDDDHGKTAHGLIRGSERFKLVAVLDSKFSGRDAGEVLDGVNRGIPVFASLEQMLEELPEKPQYAIVGVATEGGKLPDAWLPILARAAGLGISLVSGMHKLLGAYPELAVAAKKSGARLVDIRRPKPVEELAFFTGEIYRVRPPRIAVLGTDCAVGKRTTCRLTMEMCREAGIKTEMIYTGQTGWMQGYPHGFILDATPNDFVSGELEKAVVACARELEPELILLEGQSALRNPFGPCGAELILSGDAKHVILQHMPFHTYIEGVERPECRVADPVDEIELIKMFGATTIAVCLNGWGGSPAELKAAQEELQARLQIPVIRPLEEGVQALLPAIRGIIK